MQALKTLNNLLSAQSYLVNRQFIILAGWGLILECSGKYFLLSHLQTSLFLDTAMFWNYSGPFGALFLAACPSYGCGTSRHRRYNTVALCLHSPTFDWPPSKDLRNPFHSVDRPLTILPVWGFILSIAVSASCYSVYRRPFLRHVLRPGSRWPRTKDCLDIDGLGRSPSSIPRGFTLLSPFYSRP